MTAREKTNGSEIMDNLIVTIVPIILKELDNCRFNMYKDEQNRPHIVLGYKKDDLINYEKDFCIDYAAIIQKIKTKFTEFKQNREQKQLLSNATNVENYPPLEI